LTTLKVYNIQINPGVLNTKAIKKWLRFLDHPVETNPCVPVGRADVIVFVDVTLYATRIVVDDVK